MRTVAVYSDADAGAPHVEMADEAVRIGPARAARQLPEHRPRPQAARATGAEAIHPGYGFLSENTGVRAALRAGGYRLRRADRPRRSRRWAQDRAKALMEKAGVPVVPGSTARPDEATLRRPRADRLPGAGQGRRRRRRARHARSSAPAAELADASSAPARGRGGVRRRPCCLERLVTTPRHVEVQILGDAHGVRRRTCSSASARSSGATRRSSRRRRRPGVDDALRAELGAAACVAGGQGGTTSARAPSSSCSTPRRVLLPGDEHPAAGGAPGHRAGHRPRPGRAAAARRRRGSRCRSRQDDARITGHAIEARLYAEDVPARLPAPATVHAARRSRCRATSGSTPASRTGRSSVRTTTRCWPR
jgi:acetyl/propionyl-CoA carboxylase alpha subunit